MKVHSDLVKKPATAGDNTIVVDLGKPGVEMMQIGAANETKAFTRVTIGYYILRNTDWLYLKSGIATVSDQLIWKATPGFKLQKFLGSFNNCDAGDTLVLAYVFRTEE